MEEGGWLFMGSFEYGEWVAGLGVDKVGSEYGYRALGRVLVPYGVGGSCSIEASGACGGEEVDEGGDEGGPESNVYGFWEVRMRVRLKLGVFAVRR